MASIDGFIPALATSQCTCLPICYCFVTRQINSSSLLFLEPAVQLRLEYFTVSRFSGPKDVNHYLGLKPHSLMLSTKNSSITERDVHPSSSLFAQ